MTTTASPSKFDTFIKEPLAKIAEWATHVHKKRIYAFNEGSIEDKNLLGNKGANLCEMARLGLPVPPGFVITTETCCDFFREFGNQLPQSLIDEYTRGVHEIERQSGRVFGGEPPATTTKTGIFGQTTSKPVSQSFPLLLSVRSGAAVSMPGMMDTVLNLGINDDAVQSISRVTNNPRFAFDTYRRFLQMYGEVVMGVDKKLYEAVIERMMKAKNATDDTQFVAADFQEMVNEFKKIAMPPTDPWEQLKNAVEAIFHSWYNPRAVKYRDINGISSDLGTAVTIQSMVFGNYNSRSGTGVLFTRNPGTGENQFYGELLTNAEGEDVVSGVRTPLNFEELKKFMPTVYESLIHIGKLLEKHYRDMQDIEYTIENGHLYVLQTRSGKRTPRASVHVAVNMVHENLITEREALLRINASQMDFFLHPMIDPVISSTGLSGLASKLIGHGLAASAGAAVGSIVFNCEDANELASQGRKCILCREETSADDIGGMQVAEGVLTLRGGITSHAAVVMRGMGKSAVVGAKGMHFDANSQSLRCGVNDSVVLRKGDIITIDGSSGMVYIGEIPTVPAGRDDNFQTILRWADKYKRMKVFANCETIEDTQRAFNMGAEGVGLCRTEHMFFHPERIDIMRAMILSENPEERQQYLDKMLPMQQGDFLQIFRIMHGLNVTIRLLDPPLHEFLPQMNSPTFAQEMKVIAAKMNMDEGKCIQRVKDLQESNPMMGFRGCRLSIVFPEITEMQVKAIMGAALTAIAEGIVVFPEIMIPLVCSDHEIDCITPVIRRAATDTMTKIGYGVEYKMGCMMEVPRACIRADSIVAEDDVKFVSFGTNDLTQLMYGFSRDDSDKFFGTYMEKHVFAKDPFATIDQRGVGSLIQLAISKCRKTNPRAKIGVCGEHAGDPDSIKYFDSLNADYISCSPYRIPIAKIASAQAHIDAISKMHTEKVYESLPMHSYATTFFPLRPTI